jgi:hypothetical protein
MNITFKMFDLGILKTSKMFDAWYQGRWDPELPPFLLSHVRRHYAGNYLFDCGRIYDGHAWSSVCPQKIDVGDFAKKNNNRTQASAWSTLIIDQTAENNSRKAEAFQLL